MTKIEDINPDNTDVAKVIDEILEESKPRVQIKEEPIIHEYVPSEPIYKSNDYKQNDYKNEIPDDSFSNNLTKSLKKTTILFVLLMLLTNPSFKKILGKIPFTLNSNLNDTFLMTIITSFIICICFYIIDYFMN
jgi:hypothetical protein